MKLETSFRFEIGRIKRVFRRGGEILHEEGFLSLFKRFFMHETYYLYENRLDGLTFPYKVANLMLRVITQPEEFDEVLAEGFDFSSYELMSSQQCKERLARRAILFCAFVGKEIVHGSWVGVDKRCHEDFYSFPMNYGCPACIGGTMTSPKYRRKGIYTYVHSEIFRYLREKGLSKAVLQIGKDNTAPQKAQSKLGSHIVGKGHSLKLLLLFNFRWTTKIG